MTVPTLSARYVARTRFAGYRPDTLAVIGFGDAASFAPLQDPRFIRVGLPPLGADAPLEVWTGTAPVTSGRDGNIRYATDGHYCFGAIELDEGPSGDIGATAERAYGEALRFLAKSEFPRVLRMWNYFDAINVGPGDLERYRLFCAGRAISIGSADGAVLPAATAIGRNDGDSTLQVYWLAAREPGIALENPRQVAAYQYPRQYGPRAPSFSRAMIAPGASLLISGTASVVGHATQHPGDVLAQLDETMANLDSLLEHAHARDASLPRRFGPHSILKVYLRHPEHGDAVSARLRDALPAGVPFVVVHGDICRADLLIEIDATHAAP